MRLNKILYSSMTVVALLGFGAIAGSANAHAAGNTDATPGLATSEDKNSANKENYYTGVKNYTDGTVHDSNNKDTKVSRSGSKDTNAYDMWDNVQSLPETAGSNTQSNGTSASARSDAQVTIKNGILTLDAVPDFNFGQVGDTSNNTGADSNSATNNSIDKIPLQNNQGEVSDSGNPEGRLQVTDSRRGGMGWKLTAQMGTFKQGPYNGNGPTAQDPTEWAVNLGTPGHPNGNTIVNPTILHSGDVNAATIMGTDNNQKNGNGVNALDYSNKAPQPATLSIPNNVTPANYDAPITWTLTASDNSNANKS